MTRKPPHPEPLRGSALSHEGRGEERTHPRSHEGSGEERALLHSHEGRGEERTHPRSHEGSGERKLASKRQIELLTRVKNKRAYQFPSPLVGEGGVRSTPGEGALPPVAFARKLRATMTDAERRLWHALKDRRFSHLKFRRQVPMGAYVADFLSLEAKLVLEVDGSQHADSPGDESRDAWFNGEGFRVLRFWNHDVLKDLEAVLATIDAKVEIAS